MRSSQTRSFPRGRRRSRSARRGEERCWMMRARPKIDRSIGRSVERARTRLLVVRVASRRVRVLERAPERGLLRDDVAAQRAVVVARVAARVVVVVVVDRPERGGERGLLRGGRPQLRLGRLRRGRGGGGVRVGVRVGVPEHVFDEVGGRHRAMGGGARADGWRSIPRGASREETLLEAGNRTMTPRSSALDVDRDSRSRTNLLKGKSWNRCTIKYYSLALLSLHERRADRPVRRHAHRVRRQRHRRLLRLERPEHALDRVPPARAPLRRVAYERTNVGVEMKGVRWS